MSMKSFDKFCEKMILGEPGSEKEIFDERQKQLRTHILVQSLVIYAIASALCVVLNEFTGFLESCLFGHGVCCRGCLSLVGHLPGSKGMHVRSFREAGPV